MSSRSLATISAFLLCLSVTTPAQTVTSDWPQWRGPERTGISSDGNLYIHDETGDPVIANGRSYIRDLESLWAYDIKASR